MWICGCVSLCMSVWTRLYLIMISTVTSIYLANQNTTVRRKVSHHLRISTCWWANARSGRPYHANTIRMRRDTSVGSRLWKTAFRVLFVINLWFLLNMALFYRIWYEAHKWSHVTHQNKLWPLQKMCPLSGKASSSALPSLGRLGDMDLGWLWARYYPARRDRFLFWLVPHFCVATWHI